MNFTELLIIYLACGAPFGVYYFFQNRTQMNRASLVLQTMLRFILWIVFALPLVAQRTLFTKLYKVGFDGTSDLDSKLDADLLVLRKSLEQIAVANDERVSVFDFREVFDRYTGLTNELASGPATDTEAGYEIFRIGGHPNKAVGGRCLSRRNRERLVYHQKLARRDFLDLISSHDLSSAKSLIATLAAVVKDQSIVSHFAEMENRINREQLIADRDVSLTGKDIWNANKPRQFQEPVITANFRSMTVKQNLAAKD